MGRVGACADNVAMESFFSLLKHNVLNTKRWHNREDPRLTIITWIVATYHRRRPQRALGELTPIEFETTKPAATPAISTKKPTKATAAPFAVRMLSSPWAVMMCARSFPAHATKTGNSPTLQARASTTFVPFETTSGRASSACSASSFLRSARRPRLRVRTNTIAIPPILAR